MSERDQAHVSRVNDNGTVPLEVIVVSDDDEQDTPGRSGGSAPRDCRSDVYVTKLANCYWSVEVTDYKLSAKFQGQRLLDNWLSQVGMMLPSRPAAVGDRVKARYIQCTGSQLIGQWRSLSMVWCRFCCVGCGRRRCRSALLAIVAAPTATRV
jgi:hypothetical protein